MLVRADLGVVLVRFGGRKRKKEGVEVLTGCVVKCQGGICGAVEQFGVLWCSFKI